MDLEEGLVRHGDMLDGRLVMMVHLAELTWAAFTCPCCYVASHAIPHKTASIQELGGVNAGVGKAMQCIEDASLEIWGDHWTWLSAGHITQEGWAVWPGGDNDELKSRRCGADGPYVRGRSLLGSQFFVIHEG